MIGPRTAHSGPHSPFPNPNMKPTPASRIPCNDFSVPLPIDPGLSFLFYSRKIKWRVKIAKEWTGIGLIVFSLSLCVDLKTMVALKDLLRQQGSQCQALLSTK